MRIVLDVFLCRWNILLISFNRWVLEIMFCILFCWCNAQDSKITYAGVLVASAVSRHHHFPSDPKSGAVDARFLWRKSHCSHSLIPCPVSHSGISWQVTLPSASPQHTPWALPARTGGEAMQVLLVRALVYVARGISGSKQSLSPEGTVQHFHRVKPHRSGFSWERRGSSSCLCHAAAEMSTLLAGGSSTAASSSWMNLKLCCLLLPFYSFLKHRQKKKKSLFSQNKYLFHSFSRKKKIGCFWKATQEVK